MRLLPLVAGLCVLAGCAHPNDALSPSEGREVVAVADRNEPAVELTESAPPPSFTAEAGARPRLSHVVTLGQGTADAQYYGPDAQRAQVQQGGGGPTVIINNNVNGGGYGGSYGGYGYGGSSSRGSRSSSGGSGPRTESGYAPTRCEGAGRTAAQGQTPGVGGNWPSAPSYGPRQAR